MHKDKNKFIFSKRGLINLETKPKQSSAWFSVLKRTEVMFHDLNVKLVNNLRYTALTKIILILKKKVKSTINNCLNVCVHKTGSTLAQKIFLFDLRMRKPFCQEIDTILCIHKVFRCVTN